MLYKVDRNLDKDSRLSQHKSNKNKHGPTPMKVRKTGKESTDESFSQARKRCSPASNTNYSLKIIPSDLLPMDYNERALRYRKRVLEPPKLDINPLSDDILGHCLCSGYLTTQETAKLAQVSRKLQQLASSRVLELDLSRFTNLRRSQCVSIVKSFPNLRELDFSYCSEFSTEHLQTLKPLSKSLKTLGLRGTQVEDSDMVSFLPSMNQLESIDLSAVDSQGNRRIGNDTAKALANHCPRLQCVRLAWCKNLTNEGLEDLCKLTRLETIDLALTGITDCSYLSRLPHRMDVDLSATNLSQDSMLQLFVRTQFSSTRNLSLRFQNWLSRELLEGIFLRAPLLESIDLCHCTDDYEEPLRTVHNRVLAEHVENRNIIVQGVSFRK